MTHDERVGLVVIAWMIGASIGVYAPLLFFASTFGLIIGLVWATRPQIEPVARKEKPKR